MRIKRQHKLLFVILIICSISLRAQTKKKLSKSTLIIPPKQVVCIDYPYMKGFTVKLWNKSKFELGVSAREHHTDSLSKGFRLNKGSFATIQVADKHYLQLENRFIAPLKVEYTLFKTGPGKKKKTVVDRTVGFYLLNTTAQTLPILIPGIMNPKLTPFSKSGVELPWGQKILLKTPGKDLLLLTVTDTIRKGARIDVADLIDVALNQ